MNETDRNHARRAERRARAWAERAREQLAEVEARLGERYARHLAARRDPRDGGEVLRQLAARRLLPLGHGLRQASAHDAGSGSDHDRGPERAFLQLTRADRDALWPLRAACGAAPASEGASPARAGDRAAAPPAATGGAVEQTLVRARAAALRRMAERLGASRAGVGGLD